MEGWCPPALGQLTGGGDHEALNPTSRFANLISTGLLCALVLTLAFSLRRSHHESAHLLASLHDTQQDLQESSRNEKGYLDIIARQTLASPVLRGINVTAGGSEETVARDRTTVLYLLESTCQACSLNYGFLRALAERKPGAVVAISLRDDPTTLLEYSHQNGLTFPVLASPSGSWVDFAPRYGTPITMVLHQQHLVALMPGHLSEEQIHAIERLIEADVTAPPQESLY